MSTTPKNTSNDQEIDLSQISRKLGETYESFLSWIFRGILFVKRNIIIIIVLFVIGAGIGYFMDKSSKAYNNEIIVNPNYGSTDYLYAKINMLQAKIKERDTTFLKSIGIEKANTISSIEIKPIVDVYKFVDNKVQNFELIKLMAEDGDLNKIVEDKMTSKNYPFHVIVFTTNEVTDETKTINPIMDFLNESDYYTKQKKLHLENIQIKMVANDSIIKQIDLILNQFSKNQSSGKSTQLVYYNDNTQLNEMIKTKEALIQENGEIRMGLVNGDKIIKLNSSVVNIKNTKSINGKMKFVLPFVFILFFLAINTFVGFYRAQTQKIKQ